MNKKIAKFTKTMFRSIVGYPVGYEVVIDEGCDTAQAGTVKGQFYDPASHLPVYSINVGTTGRQRKDTVLEGIEASRLTPYSVSNY